MIREEREMVLAEVDGVRWGKRRQLHVLGIPKSTYYRWRQQAQGAMERRRAWNRLTEEEEATVLAVAREMPEWRSRQMAAWLTYQKGLAVSESTVHRLLRREGLVKAAEGPLPAGKEYHRKTAGPHQLWATDASYFRGVGWGYYYLVTVMDDFSRFILAWKLQEGMTTDSLIEVVQETIDTTGMDDVPTRDRTKLLSDNGSGYVSLALREYLQQVGIKHILACPCHPQTNGKLERCHRTLKTEVNQVPNEAVSDLEGAIGAFVDFYNHLQRDP